MAALELKGADQGGRRGQGIHFELHWRVSGDEAAGRQGGVVVVGALGGGALQCRR
jgi:hypothetical protein